MNTNNDPFAVLDPNRNVGYLDEDLPSTRDDEIRELLFGIGERWSVDEIGALVPRRAATVLSTFAERAATLAVRRQDARELRAGLIAAAIALMTTDDPRDVIPVLALLYRAAERLGHDPDREFAAANELCGGKAESLLQFVRRAPADRSLRAMGYEEVEDKDGFRFVYTW
ncbi:MAG: hypothetical protein IRY85_14580 [Micromonosporaceae bacterium]|nr:hypothetical protein [Micromonosporaceae bacterium]